MHHISLNNVFRQLKADLIGKDSYRGVTLTYTWLANQFGHFSLGFIPTLLIPHHAAPWIVAIAWTLFEAYNFLGPLLLNKHTESKTLYVPSHKRYTFPPTWGNIAFDTFTDLCFFWLGAFAASLLLGHHTILNITIIAIILIYPICYWYPTKMYLQQACLPTQFRLSQWNLSIKDADKEKVYGFLNATLHPDTIIGKHLFIFGGKGSGKTALGIGLATESAIKHKACLYTTAMKLYSLFSLTDEDIQQEDPNLWTWRTTSLLVIDDINPGQPIPKDIVTAYQFMEFMENDGNRHALKNKNVIWILGDDATYSEWQQMLHTIGVPKESISAIYLPQGKLS
ncbi:hypothetical protein [Chitinophaga sp. LS1]|uniref:hypothetical protein n=1 Tax=Chitinophaga sp. LS1 TaxID=3051176 RepID=UPI002AAABD56|nr:hypothetical protein [Chitinophaga sp. LS1]WPV67782.1 hypothetical protein QQL36_03450 [Chitinophaga sp. LS1]